MSVQHMAIFHCQKCGRVVHQPHEMSPPTCCDAPMAVAVPDLLEGDLGPGELPVDQEEHALHAEMAELTDWCRNVPEGGASHFTELAARCEALHSLMIERASLERPEEKGAPRTELSAALQLFIDDLRQREPSFRSWSEVRARLKSLLVRYRQNAESDTTRPDRAPDEFANRRM